MANLFEPLTHLLRKEFLARLDEATDRFLLYALVCGMIGIAASGMYQYSRCEVGTTVPVYIAGIVLVMMGIRAMVSFSGAVVTLTGVDIGGADKERLVWKQKLPGLAVYALAAVWSAALFVTIAGAVGALASPFWAGVCGPI